MFFMVLISAIFITKFQYGSFINCLGMAIIGGLVIYKGLEKISSNVKIKNTTNLVMGTIIILGAISNLFLENYMELVMSILIICGITVSLILEKSKS